MRGALAALVLVAGLVVGMPEPGFAHEDAFPGGGWAPTTARVNPTRDAAQALPRLPVDDVERSLTSWGNWTPEAAHRMAADVPVYVRHGDVGFGGFYAGDRHVEVGSVPSDLTVEHELHHAWDYTRGQLPQGYAPQAVKEDYRALGGSAAYPRAAQVARDTLAAHPDDDAHFGHYLTHGLNYDFNDVPPDFRSRYLGYGDTSRPPHLDDGTIPFRPAPRPMTETAGTPTPQHHRVFLPAVGR